MIVLVGVEEGHLLLHAGQQVAVVLPLCHEMVGDHGVGGLAGRLDQDGS